MMNHNNKFCRMAERTWKAAAGGVEGKRGRKLKNQHCYTSALCFSFFIPKFIADTKNVIFLFRKSFSFFPIRVIQTTGQYTYLFFLFAWLHRAIPT